MTKISQVYQCYWMMMLQIEMMTELMMERYGMTMRMVLVLLSVSPVRPQVPPCALVHAMPMPFTAVAGNNNDAAGNNNTDE